MVAGSLLILDRVFPPDLARAQQASVVVADRDGSILRAFETKEGAWQLPTSAEDVDPGYLALLHAYEDRRFDEHVGVDPLAVARAAWQWASSGHIVSGASTLTMQAARLLEPRSRSLGAKLHQMARALQLEERLSKERILSIYLTLAPFGGNLEGVRAASLAYFGKEPRRLSLGEAALLVALPQSPERLRPDRHPEAALAARAKVLRRLEEHGVLSQTDVADALSEPLPATRLAFPFLAPHLTQHLAAKAAPGSTIATPIDRGLQSSLEALAKREALRFDDAGDLAVVVVENRAHAVRAYLGSADFFGPHGQIDLARAQRSPGSALKPFIYGLAFEDRVIHPASLIDDEPMRFGDYVPRNFDRQFQGTVSVREALQQSLNVPAVALLDRVGAVRFVGDLRAAGAGLGFRRLVGTPSLPVALGGLGISLADLTMLYASFPNGGEAAALRLTEGGAPKPVRLMGSAAAWYVTDILRGSPLPEGYAQALGLTRARDIAFKTGTSYGFRDAWAVGYSPDYTVGVWVGRADGSPRPGHYGRNTATPILLKAFDLLPPDQRGFGEAPADALSASTNEELPPGLRHFAPDRPGPIHAGAGAAPRILFPPDGAVVEWRAEDGAHGGLPLKAEGGAKPLAWIVNGAPLERATPAGSGAWQPDGEGFARIAVVDAEGRSAEVRVRVVNQH
ncbi:MAG TPA: penicillin-binding protein 1C [Stellaceae bacterium]|nr:penicillin-binding protein 1C [Stellaceae bacterium]